MSTIFKIQNREMADMFGLPVGCIVPEGDRERVSAEWSRHLTERDEARYAHAVETAPDYAHVVIRTWQRDGKRLRRGDVVYVVPNVDGMGAAMVTRTKSRMSMIWTCGMEEVREHTVLGWQTREER